MSDLLDGFLGSLAGGSIHPAPVSSPSGEVLTALDKQQAERASRKAAGVEQRMDKLVLVCMAMWSLLKERAGLSEEDLLQRVGEIDMMDGQADGKSLKQVAKCPQCGRTMSPRHSRCLYCGATDLTYTAFDAAR
ncbi:MAG TPA: hypothetical protein VM389_04655 [Phycisphaerae bacterium]|nr:hypothetical protein [Phycisphaerae bacterium]